MAFSDLEKALLAYVGIRSPTSRKVATQLVKSIARATIGTAPAVARGGLSLAAANPVLTGAGLGLGALQTEQGQQLLMMAEERGRMDRIRAEQLLTDLTEGTKKKTKKTKTKYNLAVSKSMKAVKSSKFMGKKGTLSNPKKTFGTVSKVVSKMNKGRKVGTTGVTGVIRRASTPVLGYTRAYTTKGTLKRKYSRGM
tara:strand:- start:197 stop:784 length:588 start_codon:yes stop_codon:yes gene_type:complete